MTKKANVFLKRNRNEWMLKLNQERKPMTNQSLETLRRLAMALVSLRLTFLMLRPMHYSMLLLLMFNAC